jgi:hypothetical protein
MKSKDSLKMFNLVLGESIFFAQETFADSSNIIAAHSYSGFVPAVLDVLLLLGAIFCLFFSLKVKSFLKDGELAHGWTFFSFSFAILLIAQLLSLSISCGLLDIPFTIVSLTRLLSILFLALGIYFVKKVMS